MASAGSKNPANVAKKWSQNLAASTTSIEAGVRAVTVAPGQRAAANQAGYLSGVQKSADKWARNVAAVSTGSWQNSMITKGIPRVGTGATAAQPKMQAFMSQLLPFVDNVQQSLQSTPRGSLDQNIQRSVTFMRAMAGFSYNRSGG